MNDPTNYRDVPQDVTFFIGPIGTPEGKLAYETALELNDAGDRSALDELLELENEALRVIAGHSPEEASPLRTLLSAILDRELGTVSTFVGTGFIKGVWTPTLTIHLDRCETLDGTSLGHLLRKEGGELIAAVLGRHFKSEWIFTSWVYPGEPIELHGNNP